MNRTTSLIITVLLGATFGMAQGSAPAPVLPADLTSQQLIAWSWMQNPQPTPQPAPPRESPIPRPGQTGQSDDPQTQQEVATQTFTGKIVWQGTRYVLKAASNTTYQLDEQNLKQYENQTVKVVGNLDHDSNMINIVKIEFLS